MPEIGRLFAETCPIADPGDLLAFACAWPHEPLFVWEHPASGRALLGLGVVREIRATGPDRFAVASAAARRVLDAIEVAGGDRRDLRVVGGFAFSDGREGGGAWPAFPPARLVLPRLLWSRRDGQWRRTRVWDESEADRADALLARARRTGDVAEQGLALHVAPIAVAERAHWRARVEQARTAIARGEVRKVVLARQRLLHAEGTIDPATILRRARDARPSCFNVWVRTASGTSLIASTPELLVRREGHAITASALAGSAPRAADPSLDRRHAEALRTCPKNGREHAIVVAAVHAALATLADDVRVPTAPELLSLPEVHHLATAITARLRVPASVREPATVLEIGGVLHPTPAVCGAPRAAARAIIEAHEPDRGWYTGTVGWMDAAGDGELAVVLRSALVAGHDVTLWAGAGIVEGSDADAELAETEAKMAALVAPFLACARPVAVPPHAATAVTATPDGAPG